MNCNKKELLPLIVKIAKILTDVNKNVTYYINENTALLLNLTSIERRTSNEYTALLIC